MTNERFDKLYLEWGKDIPIGAIKTFIQEEKNLLLDQAIEELWKLNCPDGFMLAEINRHQAISKIKELKKEV